ncbi:tRNA pseudouridine(38-40) synthase TruA [Treponema primitia]|uniref:tRNA pseudouridine(38-40) synthase TruA n=1 Tax=Treponema primitia TaxID=88058 RepID=UPI00025558E9|nr:tRNA pseudouridine(38-40) synthase TruA [Treponema primitia]
MPSTLRNIKLLIAYDGTDFSGWQRQGCNRTVQGTIEAALERIHKHPVVLTGSGRTDAGVHAAGQVANFTTPISSIPAERFVQALNSLLPRDIRILEAGVTLPDFHARFDARSRSYRYHLICGRPALPHELRYNLQLWRRPHLDLLNDYARLFRGELDCSLFAWPQDPSKSRSRYFYHAGFTVQDDTLIFEIQANAFLWKMVRSVVGTLLHYEEKGKSPEELKRIIETGDRSMAGPTVPPNGLFLWKVEYFRG